MPSARFFDTHCHLDVSVFDEDRDVVLDRARAVGITRFLNPAYDLASSRRAIALAESRDDIIAAIGIHPNDALNFAASDLDALRALSSSSKVVAIGEVGLDYHWQTVPRERQTEAFVAQLHLARELGLPVIIHCREAYDDVLAILRENGDGLVGLVMHAFAGTLMHLRAALDLGYFIGIGGPVTYPNAHGLRDAVQALPLDRLLIETDAPYLAPQARRGKRNEPAYLTMVAEKVAELRGVAADDIARITTDNGRRLFRLD